MGRSFALRAFPRPIPLSLSLSLSLPSGRNPPHGRLSSLLLLLSDLTGACLCAHRLVLVAVAATPALAAAAHLEGDGGHPTKLHAQLCVRATLGLLVVLAFGRFQRAAAALFGPEAAAMAAVISAVQFHLPFYLSRPLPNIFALALVLVGMSGWLKERSLDHVTLISAFVPAVVIFRAEIVVLLGTSPFRLPVSPVSPSPPSPPSPRLPVSPSHRLTVSHLPMRCTLT